MTKTTTTTTTTDLPAGDVLRSAAVKLCSISDALRQTCDAFQEAGGAIRSTGDALKEFDRRRSQRVGGRWRRK